MLLCFPNGQMLRGASQRLKSGWLSWPYSIILGPYIAYRNLIEVDPRELLKILVAAVEADDIHPFQARARS